LGSEQRAERAQERIDHGRHKQNASLWDRHDRRSNLAGKTT
jgi:hypothetical protein